MTAAHESRAASLPTVEDHPNADVVIFDGHCRFCQAQVRKLARWDGRNRLAFISLHDERVPERYPDLTHEQMMEQMYVITADGRRYGGAAAFRYLTRRLPKLWPLAPVLHIPFSLPIWQWAYRQVAVRRYRWGRAEECEGDTCKIHLK